jgi:hypothetical protein
MSVWTGTRVPLKHGVPCMISLSMVITLARTFFVCLSFPNNQVMPKTAMRTTNCRLILLFFRSRLPFLRSFLSAGPRFLH